jgi:glycosyltransferase involved in cell wall biosynthesis
VEEKRPDLAITALEVITRAYPDARLVFAGEYNIPYENTWERYQPIVQQYRPYLNFLGLLKDPQDMADFYAACDVVILPSDTECFALAQVEAMLCGTPMVMTDIPGGRVPVQVTGMGRLARQGDAQSIGQAAVAILQQRADYIKPRAYIEQCFSFQETVDGYERIFYQHARQRRHG